MLLFDEATSALDGKAEEYIQKMLQNLLSDHTVIVIAHGLSTIINAQQIAVLADGRITGIGTHQELMKANEVYKRLYQSQWSSVSMVKMTEEVLAN